MKRVVAVVLVATLALVFALDGTAQVKQGKSRPAKTKQLMKGLVGANCGALGESLKAAPADDKAWEELAVKAAVLNEAGYLLMDDGRCPDGAWADAATTLRDCSAALIAKLEGKDLAGANDAFKAMTGACGACHKEHKK